VGVAVGPTTPHLLGEGVKPEGKRGARLIAWHAYLEAVGERDPIYVVPPMVADTSTAWIGYRPELKRHPLYLHPVVLRLHLGHEYITVP
jgi:hypothetical protein